MFKNRKDAGQKLGLALEKYRDKNVLVLGIPRGGMETAYYVARHLHADLSPVVTRKLGYPFNPEAAFGAIAEDGGTYISAAARENLTQKEMQAVIEEERHEIRRRIEKLRGGRPLPDMQERTVIITDDGIATGATLLATIELCRKQHAGSIVVAAPVAGERMENILHRLVDDVIILETPFIYNSVSQVYESFYDLSDDEAMAFVDKWEQERNSHPHSRSFPKV